jgi:6-pyruvoyl-tetrahydropterin synthase
MASVIVFLCFKKTHLWHVRIQVQSITKHNHVFLVSFRSSKHRKNKIIWDFTILFLLWCFRISKHENKKNLKVHNLASLVCLRISRHEGWDFSLLLLSCASESQNTKEDETSEPDRWNKRFQTWKIWNYDDHIEPGFQQTHKQTTSNYYYVYYCFFQIST